MFAPELPQFNPFEIREDREIIDAKSINKSNTTIKISEEAIRHFRDIAAEKGMSDYDVNLTLKFISDNYNQWLDDGKNIRIKTGTPGLVRSIEYSVENHSVYIHFKNKFLGENSSSSLKKESSNQEQFETALKEGHIDELQQFVKSGIDLVDWSGPNGETLLHLAMKQKSNREIIEYLCNSGLDPNEKDYAGKTPLHYAAEVINISGAKVLIELGGNPDISDDQNKLPIDYVTFLDENKLLAGKADELVDPIFLEWYKNQAPMLEFMEEVPGVTSDAKKMLALLTLQSFSKASSQIFNMSQTYGIQTSPFQPRNPEYYRAMKNDLILQAQSAVQSKLGIGEDRTIRLIHSSHAMEAIARRYPTDCYFRINKDNLDDLKNIMENNLDDKFEPILIDFSDFFSQGKDIQETYSEFYRLLHAKCKEFGYVDKMDQIKLEFVLLVGASSLNGVNILHIVPTNNLYKIFIEEMDNTLRENGCLPSPDKAKEIWFEASGIDQIFSNKAVTKTTLATQGKFNTICSNMNELLQTNAAVQFKALSEKINAPPYLKILPEAAIHLLEGLASRPVEKAYQDQGLSDLLQISYFKIIHAMGTARLQKDNLALFLNEIEVIHQEIQNILGILSIENGYKTTDFASACSKRLTEGNQPVVSPELPKPKICLKPSAMGAFSSILSAVETQKESKNLNIVVVKNSYYEEGHSLAEAKNCRLSLLNGTKFKNEPDSLGFDNPPSSPIDLFVGEFHHNISRGELEYHPEDIEGQITALIDKKMLADPCTVVIDTTIDLEKSDQIRSFLNNAKIKSLINEGKLNVVFLRSAQKFDMLGMDNYYGGITTSINKDDKFSAFNQRLELPEDQLTGLSYQGLTHLETYAGDSQDKYRQGLMENTMKLYKLMPSEMIDSSKKNPVRIATINDDASVFLHISTPNFEDLDLVIFEVLGKMIMREKILFSGREGFGFPTTNIIRIPEIGIRLNPGLDDVETLKKFAGFFRIIQDTISSFVQMGLDQAQTNEQLKQALKNLVI